MKLITLACVLALHPLCHAEWLTMTGNAGSSTSDYFQFDPDSIRSSRQVHFVGVRASRAQPQVEGGQTYRSFDATAEINCRRRTARYTAIKFFEAPNFAGKPMSTHRYGVGKVIPVRCWLTPDGQPEMLIKAACGSVAVVTSG